MAYYNRAIYFATCRGIEMMQKNAYDKASEIFEYIIKNEPESSDGWFYLACTLGLMGKNTESLGCFRKTYEIGPSGFAMMPLMIKKIGMPDIMDTICEVIKNDSELYEHLREGAIIWRGVMKNNPEWKDLLPLVDALERNNKSSTSNYT